MGADLVVAAEVHDLFLGPARHGLEAVAVGITHERGIVVGTVDLADAGRTVVAAAVGQRRGMEGAHRRACSARGGANGGCRARPCPPR